MALTRRVIPCLDVHEGRVVKGVQFAELRDAGDPVEAAARYDQEGGDEVTFLDISASADARRTTLDVVERTARQVFIPLTVGGGIRTPDEVRDTLNAGADKISINTAAIRNPDLIGEGAARFGSQCMVVAVDARRVQNTPEPDPLVPAAYRADNRTRWEVFTHGGRRATGIDAERWARYAAECGAGELLLTSMDRDGTKQGYDLALTRAISDAVPIPVIASGGAGRATDLVDAVVDGHADAVLAASIFHFRETTVGDVKAKLAAAGIPVRHVAAP